MQTVGEGIPLKIPMSVRMLTLIIMLAGYSAIFLFLPERALVLALIFWTMMQFRGLLYSPNITVYDNGIEANRLGIKHFTHWRDISHVRIGEINSQIYPRGINKLVKTLLYSNLLINKWRHNYDEGMEIIQQNVQESQEKFPERAYE